MTMKKTCFLNILLFLFILFPSFIFGQLIEEGRGIDKITLGIKEAKIIDILGLEYKRTFQDDYYELEYQKEHLTIGFDKDSVVNYILVYPKIDLRTKKGLKVSTELTLKDVKRKYGTGGKCSYTKGKKTMSFCYDYGISFFVNTIYKDGKQLWLWKNFFQLEKEYKRSKVVEISIEESDLKNSDYSFYEYYDGVYIPKDIEDCIGQLNKFWSDSIQTEVLEMTEEEFIASFHFGIGLWIRNNWRLW